MGTFQDDDFVVDSDGNVPDEVLFLELFAERAAHQFPPDVRGS